MPDNRTFEEILREKMSQPVAIKGKDATVMPNEAMVMAVMNNAMKGDIGAILFIRNLTDRRNDENDEYRAQQQQQLKNTIDELRNELEGDGLSVPEAMAELELIARQLITLRRVADTMDGTSHRDIQVTPQKDGSEKTELSTTNRIFNDLYKQWKTDWKELRQSIVSREMLKKNLKR